MIEKTHSRERDNGVLDDRFNDPTLRWYINQASKEPLVDIQTEVILAERIRLGDNDAYNQLVRANLLLVIAIAKNYPTSATVGFPDLISAGNKGLMVAVRRFDPNRGAKLSTYAAHWIKQSIRREISNCTNTVRMPIHRISDLRRVRRSIDFLEKNGEDVSVKQVEGNTGLSIEKIDDLLLHDIKYLSLDFEYEEGGQFSDIIEDEGVVCPNEYCSKKEQLKLLREVVEKLPIRDRNIIIKRFGLNGSEPMTLEEVGQEYGLTRERIRQLQDVILEKINKIMSNKNKIKK
jgi:RNA polymerase primary sigma factor